MLCVTAMLCLYFAWVASITHFIIKKKKRIAAVKGCKGFALISSNSWYSLSFEGHLVLPISLLYQRSPLHLSQTIITAASAAGSKRQIGRGSVGGVYGGGGSNIVLYSLVPKDRMVLCVFVLFRASQARQVASFPSSSAIQRWKISASAAKF